jgi:hypothetical protein
MRITLNELKQIIRNEVKRERTRRLNENKDEFIRAKLEADHDVGGYINLIYKENGEESSTPLCFYDELKKHMKNETIGNFIINYYNDNDNDNHYEIKDIKEIKVYRVSEDNFDETREEAKQNHEDDLEGRR